MSFTIYKPQGMSTNLLYEDMLQQNSLLIAGIPGSGKSVLVNSLIYTALARYPLDRPSGAQFILIDPKMVDLKEYRYLPHVLKYAREPEEIIEALQLGLDIVMERYNSFKDKDGVKSYDGSDLYIIIDEFADLMTTNKKRVVPIVQRIAQLARAAKVHIIICTQHVKASVIPSTIMDCFQSFVGLHTRNAIASRLIIGQAGCEKLPMYGKGYYLKPGCEGVQDLPMVSDDAIKAVISHWEQQWWDYQEYRRQRGLSA